MPKFEIDELVIAKNCEHPENNGKIVRVVALPTAIRGALRYKVEENGNDWLARENQLRKIPPEEKTTTWSELAHIYVPKVQEKIHAKTT